MSYLDSLTNIANRHDFDTTFTSEYDNDQTANNIITPAAGKLLKIVSVYISTLGGGSAGQKIRLYFGTSLDTAITFFPTTTPATLQIDSVLIKGQRNEPLKITTNLGVGKNYFIAVNYKNE
jgi:hypothetical protein